MANKVSITLIGAGNLAWNLAANLAGSRFEIVQVHSRHLESAFRLAKEFPHIQPAFGPSQLRKDVDLALIASSDHGIAEIAQAYAAFRGQDTVFAHTSGSIDLATLAPLGEHTGVFYPLQTFTRGHKADFAEIPLFLEGNESVLEVLRPLAEHLSGRVAVLDSASRLRLHLGAVFASNFTNYMWLQAERVAHESGLSGLDVYAPLIREVMEKALRYGPHSAQTGPARRGDEVTMQKHEGLLADGDPRMGQLYRILSELIMQEFKAE